MEITPLGNDFAHSQAEGELLGSGPFLASYPGPAVSNPLRAKPDYRVAARDVVIN